MNTHDLDIVLRHLTDNQLDVLIGLYGHPDGLAPLDFGGSNGSHHSNTAIRLSQQIPPIVERRFRGHDWGQKKRFRHRSSCLYRLTAFGVQLEERRRELAGRRKIHAQNP